MFNSHEKEKNWTDFSWIWDEFETFSISVANPKKWVKFFFSKIATKDETKAQVNKVKTPPPSLRIFQIF